MWPKQFKRKVPIGSIAVVGARTCCALVYSMCDLKAVQMNMQCNLIRESMLEEFELRQKNQKHLCVVFWPFDPAKNAIPRWCTGRRWHILMAVMRGNRVGGNWLMKWDELNNSHGTLIDWFTGREWPLNCMTVIYAWWRLNIRVGVEWLYNSVEFDEPVELQTVGEEMW